MFRLPFGRGSDEPLARLERRLGHRFRERRLLERALTHRSYAHERGNEEHYERLEFLGDAVLGLVAVGWLYERFPEIAEGRLSKLKSRLVSRSTLAAAAARLELGDLLRLGVGEERTGGRNKSSLLADAMEAVLGAVFLDRGFEAARRVAAPLLEAAHRELADPRAGDAKTRLQELAQARGLELPEYTVVEEEGPDHLKRFTVGCRLAGREAGRGVGRTKKIAEQRAAEAALAELD